MHFFYEQKEDRIEIYDKISVHYPPHIHKSIECIYVTEGSLELGIGETLLHMEPGDFGIVFPNVIHHYQVFGSPDSRAVYFLAPPALTGVYSDCLRSCLPENPVIPSAGIHPDIPYALHRLCECSGPVPETLPGKDAENSRSSEDSRPEDSQTAGNSRPEDLQTAALHQAFTQIILARSLPCLHLVPREEQPGHNIIYDAVAYMAAHFTDDISLTAMAQDLGYSPFALSRVFSGTFHTNFNRYLNELRLNTALNLLENPEETITDAAMSAGFTSLRTFNRVFAERFHMSPREYRKKRMGNRLSSYSP